MNIDDYINLIYKELKGEISVEENEVLNNYKSLNKENEAIYSEINLTWNLAGNQELILDDDLENDLTKLKSKIKSSKPKVISLPKRILSIAATVIALIVAGFVIQNTLLNNEIEIIAVNNMEHKLPDNSVVQMKKGSSLKYKKNFAKNRNIRLNGLAYFDVEHDELNPFIVNVQKSKVTVLGTKFTIEERGERIKVNVEEGRVEFANDKNAVLLTKDQFALLVNNDSEPLRLDITTSNFNYWLNNQFRFDGQNLIQIIEELEYIFDAEIEVKVQEMKDCTISGVFNADSVRKVLDKIASKFQMTVDENNGIYTMIDGVCN